MAYPTNSWSILPAAQVLFNKTKVTLAEVASQWDKGTVMVMKKPNGQMHFIAGSQGTYGKVGQLQKCHHDQTCASFGIWEVVNAVSYEIVDGVLKCEYAVPPVDGVTMATKAGMAVFK